MARRLPVVGITTYGPEGTLDSVSLPRPYLEAVAAAGAAPVLLGPCGVEAGRLLDALMSDRRSLQYPESPGSAGYSLAPTNGL